MERAGDLELNLDKKFAASQRRFQKLGMSFLFAALLAAVLGLFGSGPLSGGEVKSAEGGWSVKYKRFLRFQSPAVMEVSLLPAADAHQREFWISSSYLENMKVEKVTPQPSQVISKGSMLGYFFRAEDSQSPVIVRFNMQAEKIGFKKAEVQGAKGNRSRFYQWIYP